MKHRADAVVLDDGARGGGRAPGRHAAPSEEACLPRPDDVPETATWNSRSLGRRLLTVAAFAALAMTVPEAIAYWHARTVEQLQELMVVVTFAIGLWSILASCPPQVVTLDGSTLRVLGPGIDASFDLADALQRVEVRTGWRQWRWSLTLARLDHRDLVLTRRDVDRAQLDRAVRHYREVAERRRAEEWSRLGL